MPKLPLAEQIRASIQPIWDTGQFRLIVLFGSIAKEQMHKDSDLDLAFLPKEKTLMNETLLSSQIIACTHWNNIDVVNLQKVDPLLAMQIAKTGIPLFMELPSDYAEFCSLAFRRYIDTEKLRVAQRRALDQFEENR